MGDTDNDEMWMKGPVRRLVREKGFGFVKDMASGTEYFFHRTSLQYPSGFDGLQEGSIVKFMADPTRSDKGPRAKDVRVD